ncbi:hypothetical protein VISI1226_00370 [Vibrio sinaloensis DSM 21326]|uniref:Alpha-ribazole phosphatase n=1 Tax=Vibrio sinaloensis DSM 21326 TaxID=945550 RepID=E8M623_PHOS4|nr:histidine phosphatase family protein [Vibrio sinaloensis]EGA70473.1 hypothetical protein VISI1226_00370 [Vibrio sinaloensis DSM 21326]
MTEVVNVYLVRHGKTLGEPGLYGHTDIAVAEAEQQVICSKLIAKQWSVEQVVTSPLKRCHDLAELYGKSANCAVRIAPEFKEMNFGDIDGVPFDTIHSQWPLLERFWQAPAETQLPNAETLQEFNTRITTGWQQFVTDVEQDTLIICHGGTIRMILASLLPFDWRSSELYSVLQIRHQSYSHIQIIKADAIYPRVCAIGAELG